MKYIDTHGHLNAKEFVEDPKLYIDNAKKEGVEKIVIPGTTHKDSLKAIDIASKYKNVYALAALHPNDGWKVSQIDWLDEIDPHSIVGVGETGIDLYWENNPPLDVQTEIFKKHLRYAKKHTLPVIIHSRNAEQETYNVLIEEEFKNIKFVIHCCTMNKEWVLKFIGLEGYISFSGIVTFKKSLDIKEAMLATPLDKILVETDAPYLAPVPKRGKVNEPAFVKYTADFIAQEREEESEEVINSLYLNSKKIFNI